MAYNLVMVDVGFREPTKLHRMDVITGDYLPPLRVEGLSFNVQVLKIIDILIRDKPDKIIFDKSGYGYGLYQEFTTCVSNEIYKKLITVDAFGLITYK